MTYIIGMMFMAGFTYWELRKEPIKANLLCGIVVEVALWPISLGIIFNEIYENINGRQ